MPGTDWHPRVSEEIAREILGGRWDMAVQARAAWLAATEGWSPEDERVEDCEPYERTHGMTAYEPVAANQAVYRVGPGEVAGRTTAERMIVPGEIIDAGH